MTPNDRIVQAAYALLRGDLKAEPPKPYFCLAMVRVVIEQAFYGGRFEWYSRFRTIVVNPTERASKEPYSRDLEASLRDLGHALILPRTGPPGDAERYVDVRSAWNEGHILPGDIAFRWDTVKDANGVWVGHVGIIMPGGLLLENAPSRPGALGRGPTFLGPLGSWPITTVVRFDPDKR